MAQYHMISISVEDAAAAAAAAISFLICYMFFAVFYKLSNADSLD